MRQYRKATSPLVAKQDHLGRQCEAVWRGNTVYRDVSILHPNVGCILPSPNKHAAIISANMLPSHQ